MVELNNKVFTITKTSATAFTIGVDVSGFTGYTSGGVVTVAAVETGGIVVDAQAS